MSDTPTALAVRRPIALSGYNPPPEEGEFRSMIYMAKQLAEAQGFVPTHFYKEPSKILAAMLYGRDLGITPTNALQHIIVIEGKATADAQLIGMLVRRAGHRLEDVTTAEASTVTLTRGDDGSVHSFTFTMEDARRANLAGKQVWKSYPQAMLYARALTGVARKGAQDALMGVAYTPEELGAELDGAGNVRVLPPTGNIPALVPGVSEAANGNQTIPTATAIQPTPPAPTEQAAVTAGTSPDQPVVGGTEAQATPPPPTSPAPSPVPLAGPAISRRMGLGRSIGPAPKRTNTVTVEPQASTAPATAPEAPAQPVPQAEAVPAQPAPPALTEEPDLPEPVDPGKEQYLNDLRGDLRVQTARLFRVNAILDNVKRGLEGQAPNEVPPATPSEASDRALAARIDQDWPGRKLENLGEKELAALSERFEQNLAKKRDVMKQRGIQEE